MAEQEIHVGDVGTIFRITLKDGKLIVDISTQTVLKINFKKPDNTTVSKDALLTTDGKDGKLEYASEVDFLDQAGDEWYMQAYVVLSGGSWKSDVHKFTVYPNLI
jgi:hypothetical protein